MNFLYIDQSGDPVPVSKRQIKERFPNVSFPATFPKERMAEFNVFVWEPDPQPAFDAETQRLVPGDFRQEGDEYRRAWVVEGIPAQDREDAAQATLRELVEDNELLVAAVEALVDLVIVMDNRNRAGQPQPGKTTLLQGVRNRALEIFRGRRGL